MFDNFTEGNVMLDTQFFMMKYGVFIIAGFLGCIASVGNGNAFPTVKDFIKHLTMTITLSIVGGILLTNFWNISLEVCFAIVTLIAFFIKKVIVELTEILDSASDFVSGFIKRKLKITSKEEEKQVVEESQNASYVDETKAGEFNEK